MLALTIGYTKSTEKETNCMKMRRRTLWLLLLSPVLFLVSAVIEPPTSGLMIVLRVVLPLIAIVVIGLMLAGYINRKKE